MPENSKLREFQRIRKLFVVVNIVLAVALVALIMVIFK